MSDERFILCNKTTDSNVWDTLEKQCYGWEYVVSLLNELHEENMGLRAKHTQMVIIMKDVVRDLKRMDTYRYAEHLEKIANLHFLSEKELEDD